MTRQVSEGQRLTRRRFSGRLLALGAATAAAACSTPLTSERAGKDLFRPLDLDLPPPPGHVATVDGREVHADIRGTGRDIVLLHGAGANARDFTFGLAPLLARNGYRAISFDRPGLGWSDSLGDAGVSPLVQAAHLRRAALELGVRNPIVLGHSYGGAVAMAWALTAPGDISGVVSVAGATNTFPDGVGLWYDLAGSGFGRRILAPALLGLATRERAERTLASIFAPNEVPDGYLDHIGIGFSIHPERFATNARQVAALNTHVRIMEPRYRELAVPLSIVFGAEDQTVPVSQHGVRLAEQMQGAHIQVLPGVGHMPHHTQANAILAAVNRTAAA